MCITTGEPAPHFFEVVPCHENSTSSTIQISEFWATDQSCHFGASLLRYSIKHRQSFVRKFGRLGTILDPDSAQRLAFKKTRVSQIAKKLDTAVKKHKARTGKKALYREVSFEKPKKK